VSSNPLTFICLTTSYHISEDSNFMTACIQPHNWTVLAWGFVNWWCVGLCELVVCGCLWIVVCGGLWIGGVWKFVNWWCRSGLDLYDAVELLFGWNSSHCTCNKSMVICLYSQRQKICFSQHCSTMLHVSVYTTTCVHKCTWFENRWNALKICWHLRDLVNFDIC
jgi:hypothetical protein